MTEGGLAAPPDPLPTDAVSDAAPPPAVAAGRIRWLAWWGLALLVVVEIIVGRTELAAWLVPDSDAGILLANERVVVQPSVEPEILIFGNSRGRGAFLPTVIEAGLARPRGHVLNLSMGGSNIYDALLVYETYVSFAFLFFEPGVGRTADLLAGVWARVW